MRDVGELFNMLTGSSKQQTHRALLVAPLEDMQHKLMAKIEREIVRQRETGNGHLIFKCNGLTDEEMTVALYRAAQAGVRVDLLVRGVYSVRPGIPGISECMRCTQHRGPVFGAPSLLLFLQWRRRGVVCGERGTDGPQPAPAYRDAVPD